MNSLKIFSVGTESIVLGAVGTVAYGLVVPAGPTPVVLGTLAACLAVEPDAWRAITAGLILIGVAGEIAGARATGPGTFAAYMLDAIYALDGTVLTEQARVAC